jgi:hypothetical protein
MHFLFFGSLVEEQCRFLRRIAHHREEGGRLFLEGLSAAEKVLFLEDPWGFVAFPDHCLAPMNDVGNTHGPIVAACLVDLAPTVP